MSIPSYIRTEWRGRGHSVIKLSDANCKFCQQEWNAKNLDKTGENGDYNTTENSLSSAEPCLHQIDIACYISTLNIWEYEEDTPKDLYAKTEVEKAHSISVESLCDLDDSQEDRVIPPTITKETWNSWHKYWHDWKYNYVDLAWIHRFGKYCKKEESKLWYNEVCELHPHILADLLYCKDIQLEREELLCEDDLPSGEEYEKLLDDIFEELSYKRYWIHFRLFLRDNDIEINDELLSFFEAHGITVEPPPQLPNADYGVQLSKDIFAMSPVNHRNKKLSTIKHDSSDDQISNLVDLDTETSTSRECDDDEKICSDLVLEDVEKNTLSEVNSKIIESTSTDESSPEKVTVKDSLVKDNHERTTSEESSGQSELLNTGGSVNDGASKPSTTRKKNKKRADKAAPVESVNRKRPVRGSGVGWALKHLQQLGEEGKAVTQSESDIKSNTFVFGASASPQLKGIEMDIPIPPEEQSLACSDRIYLKRKHEELEEINDFKNKKQDDDDDDSSVSESQTFVTIFTNVLVCLQNMLHFASKGFTTFIFNLLGVNPFGPATPWYFAFSPYWWFEGSLEEPLIMRSMRRLERSSLKLFCSIFKPTVRRIPYPPCLSGDGLYVTEIKKLSDTRDIRENLVKVTQVDGLDADSNDNLEKGIYVLYMTEEDIDYELQDMVELLPFSFKQEDSVRNLNNFSGDGETQDVFKLPVDEAKMRCVSEEDFKYTSKTENEQREARLSEAYEEKYVDWLCSSSISFDDDGNLIPMPMDCYQKPHSLHKKISKILNHSRLMRFSKLYKCDIPEEISKAVRKYWMQRYRLFLRYDEGIKLDDESWYSVTPEVIAAHQSERCTCDVVIDAFCGAGGNSIQLAATCNRVIAIDIDPKKIALAKHNAKVYGVEDRIEFIEGDFFKLASTLKADVVFLSPPWGGIDYIQGSDYNVFKLGGIMDLKKLFAISKKITPNIAIYLPKNSNVFQIIELAGSGGQVDIEFSHISNKRKSLTAYYGNLVDYFHHE